MVAVNSDEAPPPNRPTVATPPLRTVRRSTIFRAIVSPICDYPPTHSAVSRTLIESDATVKFDPSQKGTWSEHGCNEMDVLSALGQKRTFETTGSVMYRRQDDRSISKA